MWHRYWRAALRLSARTFAATAVVAVLPRTPTMRRMLSEPWHGTWWLPWKNSDLLASVSPGTTAAVVASSGRRIACPLLALWSGLGPLGSWYREEGGPLALWQAWGDDVRRRALNAGHFFPEELPNETADALGSFFQAMF